MVQPDSRSAGEGLRRTARTNVPEESHSGVVPMNHSNKDKGPSAESEEGRPLIKENAGQPHTYPTQSGKGVSQGLASVRKAARENKETKFTALLHHLTVDLLRESFYSLKRKAAPGVDGVTWQEYETGLEGRLIDLHSRVHRGAYRARPSRRVYIEKEDGRQRPLGVAALEDKIVQQAVATILNQIYEEDVLGFSYGFRPGRSQHDALDALSYALLKKKVNYIVDADIRGFFDNLDKSWLVKFVEHRVADPRILRLIQKWLKAGVMEEGKWSDPKTGSPQGSVISPLLANIYLHYAFDLWVNVWRQKWAQGEVVVIRYADDTITGFQYQMDADRFFRQVCRREPETTRRREAGDVRLSGLYAHQREEQIRAILGAAPDDPQAHATQTARDQTAASSAHARSCATNWRMAQVGRARLLQLLRDTRKHRQFEPIPGSIVGALVAHPVSPKPTTSALEQYAQAG